VIYLFFYLALLVFWLISRSGRSQRPELYYFCLFGLFLFVAFRYRVGCDWNGYLSIFEEGRRYDASIRQVESSFWWAVKFLHYFELEYPYLNVISAAVFFVGLHALAKRQPDPLKILVLAFPILILNLAMSSLRQAMAVGFLCFAFNAFVDKRLFRMLAFIATAVTFHTSSAFFFVLAPFVKGRFSQKQMASGLVLALPGAYYMFSAGAFDLYFNRYARESGPVVEASGAPFRTALVALCGVIFLLFLDSKWQQFQPRDYKLVKMFSYGMLASFPLAFYSSVIGDRISYYLFPVALIVICRLPLLVRGREWLTVWAPFATGAAVLFVNIEFSYLFSLCYIPYRIW
jgi:hypothetical protein